MFRKQFNVKKNTNLRNSDTRKLFNRINEEINENEAEIDKKAQVAQMKIVNFQGDVMNVYLFEKIPYFFDFSETGNIYPTVFFMWKNPKAFPVLLVHEPVLEFLENGADLMLPGIIRGENFSLPLIRKGGPVAIALYSSSRNEVIGPIAVGCSMMSTDEMISCGFQGKGVQNLHFFRDKMWEFGNRSQPPTFNYEDFIKSSETLKAEMENLSIENDSTKLADENANPSEKIEEQNNEKQKSEDDETMESLLTRCFLAGLKYRLKKSGELPIDVGQFYTQCVLSCVPNEQKLDMKKTKFKKFGTFLQEINSSTSQEIIKLSKKNKGAETISEVNWNHELLKFFKLTNEKIVDDVDSSEKKFDAPIILEFVSITEPILPVLPGKSKGELLTVSELRECLTNYVKTNNLHNGKSVKMDPILSQITKINADSADWNTLIQKVQAKMTKTWVIRWGDGREFVRKINEPKIEFKVETRSGNKKVTLINNLGVFGIDIKIISHQIQTGVATSVTSHPEAVCCEGPQVIVQGNQINFISDLLIQTYKIDKKYIVGMNLAPKKKR